MTRTARLALAPAAVLLAWGAAAPARTSAATPPWGALARKPDSWFKAPEGRAAVSNVLSHQAPAGDWPKNIDTTREPYAGDRSKLQGTFDNGATVGEVRFLARAYRVNGDDACRASVLKAIDHVLEAQYPNGGWPQSYPPGKKYPRHVTFNDGTMVHLMELLRDVSTKDDFAFAGPERWARAGRAFDAGVGCILRCQVPVNGVKTVWCAQHDEVTLEPRPARSFEPVSLSGGESAGILLLLMSLDRPGPEVVAAVEAGARWFEKVKLTGIKQVTVGGDKKIVPDPNAPPLWARFYEIGTDRPIFCGRDGVVKYDIAEIEPERRNGYAWYGTWGANVARRHARWKAERAGAGR
jgi:pectate lyase